MANVPLELEDDLLALLHQTDRAVPQTIREMIVLELYRRGTISSGKAAALLGMPRSGLIAYAARLGIPHMAMTDEEWAEERAQSESLYT